MCGRKETLRKQTGNNGGQEEKSLHHKSPCLIAVSGRKNSGKTTLITKILPILTEYGWKVATIKHDGHEFQADVPGTDTYRHLEAGAYGTAIFSGSKYMIVKKQTEVLLPQLIEQFPEADLLLLEGFKGSGFPKLEVIRGENSSESVCAEEGLLAVVTDLTREELKGVDPELPLIDLNDVQAAAEFIRAFVKDIENGREEKTGY